MAKTAQIQASQTGTEGANSEAKVASAPLEVEITSANTFAQVLDYDQKGYRILFACEKGKFLSLAEDEVEQLSGFTRTVYHVMQKQSIAAEAEDPSWAKIKAEFKVGDSKGSARARMTIKGGRAEMEQRYFRPDNIGRAETRGWKPAKVGTYQVAGSHDGHVSIKAHGEDELILFERPKSFRAEAEKTRREAKVRQEAAERASYEEATKAAGYAPLRDADAGGKGFKEVI